jgi:hypothetical protein
MIYAVAPRECDEIYAMLVEHYRDEPNVTVIFDRRRRDRRARGRAVGGHPAERLAQGASGDAVQRRRVRDRRRARVAGELSSVVTVHG